MAPRISRVYNVKKATAKFRLGCDSSILTLSNEYVKDVIRRREGHNLMQV